MLSLAKDQLYDCRTLARKLRAMLQSAEDNIDSLKKRIQVENIDDFKWLNSSYCTVLRQLESARVKEYYFKNHPSLSLGLTISIQKDLTPLWDVDLKGMVNGAVETCKGSFHRFDKSGETETSHNLSLLARYERGSNTLEAWHIATRTDHFYNLTYPLDRTWHVGLGYDPALNQTEIENAAVIHYNGNYKPWLDLAVAKYKSYWSKYVRLDNYYLKLCNFGNNNMSSLLLHSLL
ncbi:Detected protein of confused Function [Hibiscus syriacus]|uniref:Hexosyltransferase n=1 Tax=Hibiscus syriacus TaxID=106335 RepID=A0A6A3A2M4_HIBSY|nr:Detected protein of confused Function [Hibiscus syriacus]